MEKMCLFCDALIVERRTLGERGLAGLRVWRHPHAIDALMAGDRDVQAFGVRSRPLDHPVVALRAWPARETAAASRRFCGPEPLPNTSEPAPSRVPLPSPVSPSDIEIRLRA